MTSPETQTLEIDETGAQPLPDAPQGGTVLLLHTEGGRDGGWAGRAALALARGWRDQDRRLFLCDASLESPVLHKAAGVANGEGISDALRFGTSFKRVAHRLDANLFMATAGTVSVDAGALRESPRWDSFTAGFSEAGALLVLFAPADGASVDALVRRADLVYVLASPGETVSADHLGGEPSLMLLRSDRQDPEAVLDADDAALATSLDWDEPETDEPDEDGPVVAADDSEAPEVDAPDEDAPEADASDAAAPDADDADDAEGDEPGDDAEAVDISDFAPANETISPWTPDDLDDEAEVSIEAGDESTETVELADDADVFDLADLSPDQDDDDSFVDPLTAPAAVPHEAPTADREDVPAWELPVEDEVEPVVAPAAEFEDPLQFLDPLIGDAADPAPEPPAGFAGIPADAGDGEPGDAATDESSSKTVDSPVVAPRREKEKSSTGRTLLILLLVVIVAAAAAAWFGLIEIPGLPLADASESVPTAATEAEAATSEPTPGDTPTPQSEVAAFGLALGSFSDLEVARAQAETWSGRVPSVQFVLAPVEVDDQAWYRLLAGPAVDGETAQALAETLASSADGVDPSNWLVREAGLAFLLGETRGRPAAEQRVSVLQTLGIPAHILRVPYSDGSEVFRVYAGAYASESEAAFLEQMLQDQEITNAPLTERLGTLSE